MADEQLVRDIRANEAHRVAAWLRRLADDGGTSWRTRHANLYLGYGLADVLRALASDITAGAHRE